MDSRAGRKRRSEALLLPADAPPGDPCPGCGRASVRLLQCGWLTAVRGCDQPDCLHPLLDPVRPLARPYTDLGRAGGGGSQSARTGGTAAASETTTSVVTLLTSLSNAGQTSASSSGSAQIVSIAPEEVFVQCLCPSTDAAAAAAGAAALFCRAPGGPVAAQRAAYRRCLRTVRATFRLSTAAAGLLRGGRGQQPGPAGGGGGGFRGLQLDAEMSAAVDREVAVMEAGLGAQLAKLTTRAGGPRDRLYNALRGLYRYCARSGVTLKQMCTACFQQHTVQSRCTVLRVTNPAADLDLSQPLKRVLLRRCRGCGAPGQRVLFAWEGPPGPSAALIVESPDGISPAAAALHSRCRRRIVVGAAEFAPAAVVERRRRPGLGPSDAENCDYVVWLYSPEGERWMAMSPDCRFACYTEADPACFSACDSGGHSDIVAVVYELATAPAVVKGNLGGFGVGDSFCGGSVSDDIESVASLDQPDEMAEAAAEVAAADAAAATPSEAPTASAASECGASEVASGRRLLSLRERLHRVMRSRGGGLLGDDPDGGFVMSRFLDEVASCAAAATAASIDGSHRQRRRRIPGYAEDARSSVSRAASVVTGAATTTAVATPSPTTPSTGDADENAEEEFDIYSLFL